MRIAAIAVAEQCTADVAHRTGERLEAAFDDQFAETVKSMVAGKGPVNLDRTQRFQQLDDRPFGLAAFSFGELMRELFGRDLEGGPAVGAQLQRAVVLAQGFLGFLRWLHVLSPRLVFCVRAGLRQWRHFCCCQWIEGGSPNAIRRWPGSNCAKDWGQLLPGQKKSARPSFGQ